MKINEKQFSYKQQDIAYQYKGIRIFADRGIHEWVHEEFLSHNFDKNTKILILWSGAGALDQRIIDSGYTDIVAIDIEPSFYKADNKNIFEKDLNIDFSDIWKFDVIFAVEIIEHLENQFHFMRNVAACLVKNGHVFLTTPNITSPFSRLSFFVYGNLHAFSQSALEAFWHINPILDCHLTHNIRSCWLDFERKEKFCRFPLKYDSIGMFLKSIIVIFLSFFMGWKNNVTDLYIIKK